MNRELIAMIVFNCFTTIVCMVSMGSLAKKALDFERYRTKMAEEEVAGLRAFLEERSDQSQTVSESST